MRFAKVELVWIGDVEAQITERWVAGAARRSGGGSQAMCYGFKDSDEVRLRTYE